MKNIVESPEVFEAYARIDLAYYALQELHNQMGEKQSPIECVHDSQNAIYALTKTELTLNPQP